MNGVPDETVNPNPADVTETTSPGEVDPRDQEIAALQGQLAECARRLQAAEEQVLRVQAESQTIMRRLRQQMEDEKKFGPRPLVESLLPVLDNFQRSMAALQGGANPERILEGVGGVERQLRQALEGVGVQRIPTEGMSFDPERHEAIVAEPSAEHEPDTILNEIAAGYEMHGRIIRPAQVRVTVAPDA